MAEQDDFLAQEYLLIQKIIEDYDGKALTAKAWSVTFSAVAIGLSYDKQQLAILIVSIISSLAFWLVESLIKVNQLSYYDRASAIEQHFAGNSPQHPFQILKSWHDSFNKNGKYKYILRVIFWPHVFMPHLAVAIIGTALLIRYPPT